MNHIYSVVYNVALGQYQVASEKIKQRRVSARKVSAMAIAGALMLSTAGAADIVIKERPVNVSSNTTATFQDYTFRTQIDKADALSKAFSSLKEAVSTNTKINESVQEFNSVIKTYVENGKPALIIDNNTEFNTSIVKKIDSNTRVVIATNPNTALEFKNVANENILSQLLNITSSQLVLRGNSTGEISITGYKNINDNNVGSQTGGKDGAIYAFKSDVDLKYIKFNNNFSFTRDNTSASGWARGAAMHSRGSLLSISNAKFSENKSIVGEGVLTEGGIVFIEDELLNEGPSLSVFEDVLFKNNLAEGGKTINGGVFYIKEAGKLTLNRADFTNNRAGLSELIAGGALHIATNGGGQVEINDSAFIGNTADSKKGSQGAAIFVSSNSSVIFKNVVFKDNLSKSDDSSKAIGGAIYTGGSLKISTDRASSSIFSGNIDQENKANSIHFSSWEDLVIEGKGTLDMRDPMTGIATTIKKDQGGWKLGGDNKMSSLAINEGTLYLYKQDEVENSHKGNDAKVAAGSISAGTTTFGSDGKSVEVIAAGGNTLSGDSLTLHAGTTGETKLTFYIDDEKNVLASKEPMTADTSVMKWNFNDDSINASGDGKTIINVAKQPGNEGDVYHLVNSRHGLNSLSTDKFKLSFYGVDVETLADGHRLKGTMILGVENQNIFVTSGKEILRGDATWTNKSQDSIWNINSENWNVVVKEDGIDKTYPTFAPNDKVIFGDNPGIDQTITVAANGADYVVNGMDVNATKNYTFNGDGISLAKDTSIQKGNTGNLTFNNIVKGDVALTGGTLIIGEVEKNKTAKVGSVVAGSGTVVTGHGTVNGSLTLKDGATLSSDKDINHLTIGDLIMESGSQFVVNANSDGTHDTVTATILNAEGAAKTNGDIAIKDNVTLNIAANGSENTWKPSTVYDIMIAEGKITGNFTGKNIITDLTFLTPETALKAGTDKVMQLTLSRNAVALEDYSYTFNQTAVANNIDKMPSGHAVNDAIVGMKGADVAAAFDNLSGELYASTESALFQNADHLRLGLQQRFTATSRTLWVDALGYSGSIKGDGNAAKVDTTGYGMIMGYDHAISEDIMLGAAIGFEETKVKSKEHGRKGENKVKSTHFALYGLASVAEIDLKAVATYSALRFKGDRQIWVPGLEGNAKSSYRGHQIQLFLEGSKTIAMTESYNVTPYANIAYTKIKANSFTESGSKAALTAQGQSNQRTAISIGARQAWNLDSTQQYAITADAAVKYTFGDKALEKNLSFTGTDSIFTVRASSVARTSMVLGLGMKVKHNDMTIDVGYSGEFSNRVKDHSVGVNFKLNL